MIYGRTLSVRRRFVYAYILFFCCKLAKNILSKKWDFSKTPRDARQIVKNRDCPKNMFLLDQYILNMNFIYMHKIFTKQMYASGRQINHVTICISITDNLKILYYTPNIT